MKKILLVLLLLPVANIFAQNRIEKWRVFELTLKGTSQGNPFTEIQLSAEFTNGNLKKTIYGFYDGNGIYKIRFMPQETGTWNWITSSNSKPLNNKKGSFECIAPTGNNHGPVVVKDTFYFAYSDGEPHYSFGTTCYAWVHQGDSMADLTLKTLANGYFNKIRFCIFPKDYDWNKNEPLFYPFEGKPLKDWDFTRFNPAYFQNVEKRIEQLDALGIEADLIVFHPYDRWGFQNMDTQTDERYIRYVIARFSAYKNVWWSMANEYDFMRAKKMEDWDKFIELFAENDPYNHLRGIHNGAVWYDHKNPLITHASIQSEETFRAKELRIKYKKPVVFDECRYEGNVPWSWGNLTPQEMVNKFWRCVTNGGFAGHGETYVTETPVKMPHESNDNLWWSKGGILRGQSPERILFLKNIIESSPGYLKPANLFEWWMPFSAVSYKDEYYLAYYNMDQPRSQILNLPEKSKYTIEIIDAWNMTITPVEGEFSGRSLVVLPQKPFTGLRITKIYD
jgi:hypothetical protein